MSLAYLQQESTPILPESIWALAWSPLNHVIAGAADGHLRVFDSAELSRPLHDLNLHPLAITSLSHSSDGTRILSASLDGTVALTNPVDGSVLGKLDTGREKPGPGLGDLPAYACALHPFQACWAWSGRSSNIAIRSIQTESTDETVQQNGNGGVGSGQGPLSGSGSVVDTAKGKFGMDLQFSPDGKNLALATESGHIVVLDTETQAVTATYTSHAMSVRTLSWSTDSQWLFSGSDDHHIVLHDVRAGSRTGASGKGEGAVAILQGHQSWVLKVASSPDGKLLGSGGADNLIKLWDVGQRACVSTSSSTASVWGFSWQPVQGETFAAGKQFVVAGDDRGVTLYRAAGSA